MIVIAPDLTLRAEQDADLAFALALYREGRAAEFAGVAWPDTAKRAFLDDQFRLQSTHFARVYSAADRWIVERAALRIGRLYVYREPDDWLLVEIGLTGAVQGQGIGTRLIDWLAGSAATAGAAALALQVAHDNLRAAALYRRLGFVPAGPASATHQPMRRPLS